MARLQDTLVAERDVRLVSMTVDPAYDTPEVLARYAQRFAAHPQRWLFLTGEKATLYRLAREGFHLGVVDPHDASQSSAQPAAWRFARRLGQLLAPPPAFAHDGPHAPEETPQSVTHSARLVLVDRQGNIRHYSNSLDWEDVRRLPRDVRRVLREQ
jgi:protein SCO1/2